MSTASAELGTPFLMMPSIWHIKSGDGFRRCEVYGVAGPLLWRDGIGELSEVERASHSYID